jgi:hypothetical protein
MADAPEQAPKDLIGFLDFYLVKKAPFQIPEAGREFLVKFGPWIALVLMVLTLPFLLFLLGIGTFLSPFAGVGYAAGFGLTAILILAQFALRAMALPGLFARKMSGWNLLFYSSLVGFVASLMSYNVIGGILGLIIGLYILFQVRSKYS